jgi:phosphopantetheinyl transferase (holo-ACP synthase)
LRIAGFMSALPPPGTIQLHAFALPPFADATARSRYVWAKVRPILAAIVGCAPEALTVLRSANGKPSVSDFPGAFSLAHDDALALLAIGRCNGLGVDVITPRPIAGARRLAVRVLNRAEQGQWELADEPGRQRILAVRFATIEAVVKALDWRLWEALGGMHVLRQGRLARIPTLRAQLHLAGGEVAGHLYALAADMPIEAVELSGSVN